MLFNGFTEKASEALTLALKKAMDMGHTYIGSEHILYGLLICKDSTAYAALDKCCITESEITAKMESLTGRGLPTKLTASDFSPRSRRILENAIALSKAGYRQLAGTEHILRAILKDNDCYATVFLKDIGINTASLYSYCTEGVKKDLSNALKKESKKNNKLPSSLSKYGRDLTDLAADGKLDPCIGRNDEINRVIEILLRRTKNNPCLIGEPGVGKTAIAEGLALKIVKKEVPAELSEKRIFSLDITSMLAGAKYRGDFEERIKNFIDDISKNDEYYIFIDEIHNIVGAGAAEGAIDAANILKPLLARGEIHLIGATTVKEYRKYIEKDAALERRFQPIMINEPSVDDTIIILDGLKNRYEMHHGINISDEAIKAAAELSDRYINDRFLPDKAIDLVDEAASSLRLRNSISGENKDTFLSEDKLKKLRTEKENAVINSDLNKAVMIREEEKLIEAQLREKSKTDNEINEKPVLTACDIADIVSKLTGIPVGRLEKEKKAMLNLLEEQIFKRVIGQEKAVKTLCSAIRRRFAGLSDEKCPLGSFLFLGSTGTGKTECCKALAEALFGNEKACIRLDMSEYMEKHAVSKLIGAPAGYVGYEDGGQLTEKVRRSPYSVVLFDEIEKAHPEVCNILLQILEDGILTDSNGRKVNFKNTVIIMTGNIGSNIIAKKQNSIGFSSADSPDNIESNLRKELLKFFRPEFLGRIDDIVVFNDLTDEDYKTIANKLLQELALRCKRQGITVEFADKSVEMLCCGISKTNGKARDIRRMIRLSIEELISAKLISGEITEGDTIKIDCKTDGVFYINTPVRIK
ncbi:MAG: ATP-dependent Clp protease ATP-binding subunit [Ruminiclostridium sp.]|nr:ATP-dependent Clp protease ATP-binding subunit [Ruminiclostridium sp.]